MKRDTKTRTPADLHIRRAGDAQRLLAGGPRFARLFVEAPQLPEAERQQWQARLHHDYSACGCGAGSAAGVLGVLAAAAYLLWAPLSQEPWQHGGTAFGLVLSAVLAGKVLGLLRARWRLRGHVRRLQQLLG